MDEKFRKYGIVIYIRKEMISHCYQKKTKKHVLKFIVSFLFETVG